MLISLPPTVLQFLFIKPNYDISMSVNRFLGIGTNMLHGECIKKLHVRNAVHDKGTNY